uniref:EGF-like domain-containing protein n=1 Tax=Meleagris gallopavo TaxID=9103 RepID=A0A803YQ49_MELGA
MALSAWPRTTCVMERRTVQMALTRMGVLNSVTPQRPSTVLAAPCVLGLTSAVMGCHSVPMPRMRWAAGAPHRTVPCAAMLPPAASPRAGCAMAMPTAWITPTSRDACRRSAAHLNSPATVGSAWPWLCAVMGTLIAATARMRRAVPCPGLCCAAQVRWSVPTVGNACLRPGAVMVWLTAETAQMSRWVSAGNASLCPWRAGGTTHPLLLQDCPLEEQQCGERQWGCSRGHECIPDAWRCDRERDCSDGSDEAGCQPTPCLSHEYPCGLGICLNASLVCSGHQDCADGSDEGGNCSLPCQRPCSQLCYPSPQGPRCWCAPGYQLAEDGMSCVDVDECTEQGKETCSQICLNAPGTYSCGCLSGYLLEPDGRICKLSGPEPMLLVAVQSEVLSYGLRSGREEVLLTTDKERTVFSLDFDLVERKIFWMDLATESISWRSLDSSKKGTLVKGVRSDCIAVDWLGRNLYWTDGVAGQVLATSLGTAWRGKPEYTVVLDGDLDQPHSLVLQPLAGMLYWSEVGNQPRLMEATMDGRRQRVLLAQGLGWPTALALDLPTSRLFWLDEKLGSVGSTHLDGTDVKVLQLRWVQSPFAAAVCEDQLYWSERKAWSVQQVDKATGKNRTVLLKRHGQPHGLQVMHPALRLAAPNPCTARGCSHLCLLSSRHAGQCRCPIGLTLAADETTCLPLHTSAFALLVSPAAVMQVYLKDMPRTAGGQGLPPHRALPLAKVVRLTAVDYMVKDKSLYFAEVGGDSIGMLRLKDSGRLSWKKVVAVEGMVVSLALDWLSGNLYWIEGQPTSIRVATAGGRWVLMLLSRGCRALPGWPSALAPPPCASSQQQAAAGLVLQWSVQPWTAVAAEWCGAEPTLLPASLLGVPAPGSTGQTRVSVGQHGGQWGSIQHVHKGWHTMSHA